MFRLGKTPKTTNHQPLPNTTSPPLNHVPTSLIYRQRWGLHHPGQLIPLPHHPSYEEILPDTQSKPPLAQLEAIISHPITCHLKKKQTGTHFAAISFQVVVESDAVFPEPPLPQTSNLSSLSHSSYVFETNRQQISSQQV